MLSIPATSNSLGISLASFSFAMSFRGPVMTIGRLKLAGTTKKKKKKLHETEIIIQ